ncbi:MAG: galactose mutarotase [Bacteroidales bacterium]|nr:galactose mutarotase [Bacteroidales bacterium]
MTIKEITHNSHKGIVKIYTISNTSGASVTLSSIGAGIVSINVPDKNGVISDVVIGYDKILDYLYDGPCAGKTAGRYANRIAKGQFIIKGIEYSLNKNCGPNSLHGGPEGFQNQNWDSEIKGNKICFTYHSKHNEENFPGNVKAIVEYEWKENNTLTIELTATTDADTVINLTNHSYFNLKGEGNGDIFDHILQLNCNYYLPTDDTLVPIGEYAIVKDTPMDFTKPKRIGKDIHAEFSALKIAKGYDHCWLVDNFENNNLKEVGILYEESSGRVLKISSTQVGVQVYTGNWLNDCPLGKNGHKYYDYCAVAIECQGLPDAPNKPNFPSQLLKPGERYNQIIEYSFNTL